MRMANPNHHPRKPGRKITRTVDESVACPAAADSDAARDLRDQRAQLESTLRNAARGDQDAWRVLVQTYSTRIFGLIRAQCGSPDLAEEITQSAFCTVVAKIGGYTELGKFEQWLFRIAMNRLRDEMRRRKRQARPVEDEALHAMADAGRLASVRGHVGGAGSGAGGSARGARSEDLGFAGADPEQLAALRSALADLPDADQQIIHLRHSAGLSFKEIAEVLEQPLGTVLARQHRALKKLADVLKAASDHEPPAKRERGDASRASRASASAERPGAGPGPASGVGVQSSGP